MTRLTLLAGAACALFVSAAATAQSTDSDLGTVYMTAITFCPLGTVEANGQLLSITNNSALFSLLGTTYGGDGRNTFAVPDLRARAPIGYNASYAQGSTGGSDTASVTLTLAQMPAHAHSGNTTIPPGAIQLMASVLPPTVPGALNANFASFAPGGPVAYAAPNPQLVPMAPTTVQVRGGALPLTTSVAGGGQPIAIPRDPYVAMRYCIVSSGLYPARP